MANCLYTVYHAIQYTAYTVYCTVVSLPAICTYDSWVRVLLCVWPGLNSIYKHIHILFSLPILLHIWCWLWAASRIVNGVIVTFHDLGPKVLLQIHHPGRGPPGGGGGLTHAWGHPQIFSRYSYLWNILREGWEHLKCSFSNFPFHSIASAFHESNFS